MAYNSFIFDTETSGFKGLPLWHENNRIIQIAAIHVQTRDTFNQMIFWGDDFYLAPQNVTLHKISQKDLKIHGVSPLTAAQSFLEWIAEKSDNDDRPILMIAHNALFDVYGLRKLFYKTMQRSFSRNAADLNWVVFDTLPALRFLHPDLSMEYWPTEKPYSLPTLVKHFFHIDTEKMHDALTDVSMTARLFEELILPKMPDLQGPEWNKNQFVLNLATSKRLTRLVEIKGIGFNRAFAITDALNRAFSISNSGPEYKNLRVPPGLATIAHLIAYGMMKWQQKIDQLNKLGDKISTEHNNQWWWISHAVEELLRKGRESTAIYSDELIGRVIAAVNGIDLVDLTMHTMREDGNIQYFPCCRGEAVAWLPLRISDDDAKRILVENDWGTVNELLAEYFTTPPALQPTLLRRLNQCLYQPFDLTTLPTKLSDLLEKCR